MKKLLTFFLAMIASITMMAQVTTSSISGKITDEQRRTLPGATVVATHTPSGTQYYAVADANGTYRLLNIRPGGPYKLEFRMVGFGTTVQQGIITNLGETRIVNVQMNEEAVGLGEVTIAAQAVSNGMDSDRAGATTAISTEQIDNLPTITRSLNDVLSLTPQAATHGNNLSIGGGNYRASYVTVDGAAFNNAFGIGSNLPANGSPISLDALETMTINITPYDVRQSGFTGGAINAVTKSGTNEWHATIYDYFQNNNLKGYMVKDTELNNSYSLNNTTGFSIGGPIVKDKLFFFANAEYSMDNLPNTRMARTKASDVFGDNVIYNRPLVSEMDGIKSFLANQFGYDPGRYQNYSLSTPDYKVLARLDWNINEKNTLAVRFSNTHNSSANQPSSSMSPLGGTNTSFNIDSVSYSFNRYSAGRQAPYALPFESARYFQEQNFMSVAAELNTRINNRTNNMFRLTWSHQDEPRSYVSQETPFPTVDILSSDEVTGTNSTAIFTTFGPDPFTFGNSRDVQTVIATDEFSYITGIHSMTGGLQFEWNRSKNGFMQGGRGWYIYDSWQSFVDDVTDPSTASGPVLYMITHPNDNDVTKQLYPSFDYSQLSLYYQDEMNLSEYFRMTAGLRLEMPFLGNPNNNYNADFDAVAQANPGTSFEGLSTADLPKMSLNVSPRLGFNWDILKDRSLILRGGTGIFTGRIPFVWIVSAMGNANVLQYQYIANPNTGNAPIHFHQNVADQLNELYGGNFQSRDLAAPTSATILAKDLKMPSAWKSSLGLDAKLPGGIKATFEGVYSYNFNEVYATILGYKQEGTLHLEGEPEDRLLYVNENVTNMDGGKMNGYYLHNEKGLHGYYYSLTAQLQKNFESGLNLMAAYTHSDGRAITDGDSDQISGFESMINKNGPNAPELGYASYLAPNRVIASVGFDLKESDRVTDNFSLFYEGFNIGIVNKYSYTRLSYLMKTISGINKADQLIYIPTNQDLANMTFVSERNKEEFKEFIENDRYLSKHRGEYEKRNAAIAPWLNRINIHIAREITFDVCGKKNALEIAADVKNVANLLNSHWGSYKSLSNNVILEYNKDSHEYTFTKPTWDDWADNISTWSAVLSFRYKF